MIDYIIVGGGLAGIAMAETVLAKGKSVAVFDSGVANASGVAAGVYNPVILKRFSGLQHAQEQLDGLRVFYEALEAKLGVKVNFPMPILRRFFSVEEQNNWFAASDRPGLSDFLSTQLVKDHYAYVESPFDFGLVTHTGYVDTQALLRAYHSYLQDKGCFFRTPFNPQELVVSDDGVAYQDLRAHHVVFAEGFGLKSNPYFNHLPLNGTKGEVLLIRAPKLNLDAIIKGNVFVLPMGSDLYKVGATYNWEDKTTEATPAARQELIEKLTELISCDYEIVDQQAGIRPTVKDRKPLLGTHAQYNRLHLLNGLGTRGVMLGPYCAQILFEHIEQGTAIPASLDIKRFA